MRLSNLRILLVSLGAGIGLGLLGGIAWAAVADKLIWHGIGTGWVILGIIAFGIGMIGATEPPQGWATGNKRRARRRNALREVSDEHPNLESASSLDLAVWGLVVGGGLIALAMLAFTWAV
ncbi:MAG: hypothetical protein GEU78_16460 [Actinobacteria bacterium]|nr:hypothetical protein [Actinomycetota bacterium]